jgi:hypothetical protein
LHFGLQGALRLPDSFVPHSTSIGAIADFIVDALSRPLTAAADNGNSSLSSSSLSSSSEQGQRILGLYGPSLSGKSTTLRAAFGQLIREAAQHDKGASDHSASSSSSAASAATASATATASASALPLAGVEGAVTGSLLRAAGGLAASEKVRLVYIPVGDNFKVARHVTQLMADMLGYRPMYFFLISRLPLAWRFGAKQRTSPGLFVVLLRFFIFVGRTINYSIYLWISHSSLVIKTSRLQIRPPPTWPPCLVRSSKPRSN